MTRDASTIFVGDEGASTIDAIRAKSRRLAAQGGLDLVIVDYLQLMQASGRNSSREQDIAEISRGLKALAKDLNVPVVALSQLNRAVEQDGEIEFDQVKAEIEGFIENMENEALL